MFAMLFFKSESETSPKQVQKKSEKVWKKIIRPKFSRFRPSWFDHLVRSSRPSERIGRIGNRNKADDELDPNQYVKHPWKADAESVLRNRDFRNRCGDRARGRRAAETEMRVRVFRTRVSAWIPSMVRSSHSVVRIIKTLKKISMIVFVLLSI